LADLHGQHDHQSLLHGERHIEFLDAWIGVPAVEILTDIREKLHKAESLRRNLAALKSGLRDREHQLDLLQYQINEIEAASPQPGELETLEQQLSRLRYAEKLQTAVQGALAGLNEEENCAVDQMGSALRSLEEAAKLDPTLESTIEPIRTAYYALQDGVSGLRAYLEGIESDPAALETTAEKIDLLKRLRRKYGEDEAEILLFLEQAREKHMMLSQGEHNEAELEQALANAEEELRQVCAHLTQLRTERAKDFSDLVQHQLRDLAMDKALFEVSIRPKLVDSTGADAVEFFFSANAGEPIRALSKIASGGEISRVMLAIKTAMAGRAGVPTLIFDEVDAGLGGRAAAVVARKLEELAQHYQVLVISHLPQIASRASSHYRIEKEEQGGRVKTVVRSLNHEERVEEIGRMLAGEHLSQSALTAAREMLHA